MTDTNQLPPLPILRPGDSRSERLIDAAMLGHASTREAMRWLVRQIVPQPAHATQADVTDEQIEEATKDISLQSPMARWRIARAILALRPVQVPMTDEQAETYARSPIARIALIRSAEIHHGITAQAKKEDA